MKDLQTPRDKDLEKENKVIIKGNKRKIISLKL
jgi:hypothetical protein